MLAEARAGAGLTSIVKCGGERTGAEAEADAGEVAGAAVRAEARRREWTVGQAALLSVCGVRGVRAGIAWNAEQ
jgi:hypothetical protein